MMRLVCFGWLCVFFGQKWYTSSCALCCLPRLRGTKISFNIQETGNHFQSKESIMQLFESQPHLLARKSHERIADGKRKSSKHLQLNRLSMVDEPTTSEDDSESDVKKLLISWIRWYRNTLSPIMPPNCRFLPSCSNYAMQAIDEQGSYRGLILTTWRILRCNPFGGSGYDPPVWPPPGFFAGSNSKRKR